MDSTDGYACLRNRSITRVLFNLPFPNYLKAPENATLRGVKATSIVISLVPAPDSPGVTFYKAEVEGNFSTNSSCLIMPTAAVMECELEGLTQDTEYSITARACITNSDADICGERINLTAKTLPEG